MSVASLDQAIGNEDPLEGMHLIDCDAHVTEPPDLWSSRVPSSMTDAIPVMKTVDGKTAWYMDGQIWASIGGNAIGLGRQKRRGVHMLQPFSEVDEAAWDVNARLGLMDEAGIYAAILYPNAVGFSSNHIFAIEDLEHRKLILQTYNDYLMDVQSDSGERLLTQPLLPVWDMDATVLEMQRLIDRGARGFVISDKPSLLGLPDLLNPYFEPLWDLANDSRSVISFHIGSGAASEEIRSRAFSKTQVGNVWESFGPQRSMAVNGSQMSMSNVRVIANLCMSNLFDRFDQLKIVSTESGIGWIPFVLECLEYNLDEFVTDPTERSLQQRRPTEYFRDHLYATFWFESVAPRKLIEDVGVNNVLVETDVPHPTCLYPNPRAHFAEVLGDLEPAVRRRVVQDNAAELFRINLPG